jgi:hypothetical protein
VPHFLGTTEPQMITARAPTERSAGALKLIGIGCVVLLFPAPCVGFVEDSQLMQAGQPILGVPSANVPFFPGATEVGQMFSYFQAKTWSVARWLSCLRGQSGPANSNPGRCATWARVNMPVHADANTKLKLRAHS